MSTPPCSFLSSLQPASKLRRRTPPPRAPPIHGTIESNARPHAFPPTAIVDHPRRGFSAWPARFRWTFELRPDLLFGHNQLGHHGGVKNALALRRGANSSAALCGFLSPGKLWSLSAKEFAWHLGVHCAPCPFRQYVPIHSRPNS